MTPDRTSFDTAQFEVVISLCCNATLLLLDHRHLLTGNIHLFICPSLSANLPPTSSLGAFTPRFAIGTILIVAGSLFRLWSYHALGALFTFEILIRDDHRLITSGPYAYVRHPSYTAIALLLLGVQLAQFGSGSYISACVDGSNAMWLVRSWQAASIFVVASLYRRCGVEDAALHKRFGAAWIQYSKAVPYILLPYIL